MILNIRFVLAITAAITMNGLVAFPATAGDINSLAENCADCHGKDGASTEPAVPIIGGSSAQYIIDSMLAYQEKGRPCVETEYLEGKDKGSKTDMCKIAKKLNETEIEEISGFFAGKPFVRAKQAFDAARAAEGEKIHDRACNKCHEDGGSSAADDAGILAGQWIPYLRQTFKDYAAETRPQPKKMKPKMEKLSDDDIESLLHYYGSIQ